MIKIRNMDISDYGEVYKLWLSTSGMGLNKTDDSESGIKRYLNRNPKTCFVAEENGAISGVILSGHDGRRGIIYHMAVKADMRRRGIGSALLEAATDALKKEQISKILLVVFKENKAGNEFWENRGFSAREDLVYRNKDIRELEKVL